MTLYRVTLDTVGPSVQGQPVVWAMGLVALALVVFTGTWVASLVTVAHEGGHVVVGLLAGRRPKHFEITETRGGGSTSLEDSSWGAGWILALVAGYPAPSLLGLAGVSLVLDGKAWSLLWAVVVLLIGAFLKAKDLFTMTVVVLVGVSIGWVAIGGSPAVQAALAVLLIWILLFGSIRSV